MKSSIEESSQRSLVQNSPPFSFLQQDSMRGTKQMEAINLKEKNEGNSIRQLISKKAKPNIRRYFSKMKQSTYYKDITKLSSVQKMLLNDQGSDHFDEKAQTPFLPWQEQANLSFKITNFQELVAHLINTSKVSFKSQTLFQKIASILKTPISQNNPFILVWNCAIILLVLHNCFSLPLQDAFPQDFADFETLHYAPLIQIELFILITDIVLQFNLMSYNQGQLLKNKKKIALSYLSKGFRYDLISLIGYLIYRNGLFQQDSDFQISIFIQIRSVSQTVKQNQENELLKEELYGTINSPSISVNSFSFLCMHLGVSVEIIFKCLQAKLDSRKELRYSISLSRLSLIDVFCMHDNDYSWIWGYYSNQSNRIFSLHFINGISYVQNCQFISSGVFAYSLNTITSIITDVKMKKRAYKKEVDIISNYMNKRKIDQTLQSQIKNYLKCMHKAGLFENMNEQSLVLSKLNGQLKDELELKDKGVIFNSIKTFADNFNRPVILKLIERMQELRFLPGELIKRQGTENEVFDYSFIYIQKGKLDFVYSTESKAYKLFALNQGSHWGLTYLFEGIGKNCDNKYSIISRDFSIVYVLRKQDFDDILYNSEISSPFDRINYRMIKDNVMLYQNYSNFDLKCYLCQATDHQFYQCSNCFHIPNKNLVIAKANFQLKQTSQRSQQIRNKKERYNSIIRCPQTNTVADYFNQQLLYENEMIEEQSEEDEESEIQSESDSAQRSLQDSWKCDYEEQNPKEQQIDQVNQFLDKKSPLQRKNLEDLEVVQKKKNSQKSNNVRNHCNSLSYRNHNYNSLQRGSSESISYKQLNTLEEIRRRSTLNKQPTIDEIKRRSTLNKQPNTEEKLQKINSMVVNYPSDGQDNLKNVDQNLVDKLIELLKQKDELKSTKEDIQQQQDLEFDKAMEFDGYFQQNNLMKVLKVANFGFNKENKKIRKKSIRFSKLMLARGGKEIRRKTNFQQ